MRKRIFEWRAEGGQVKELAAKAGVSQSHVIQVRDGMGVGGITRAGYARALGYADEEALQDAAWQWWQAEGKPAAAQVLPVVEEAIEAAVRLGYGTEPQLRALMAAHGGPTAFRAETVAEVWAKLAPVVSAHRAAHQAETAKNAATKDRHEKMQAERAELESIKRSTPPAPRKRPKSKAG